MKERLASLDAFRGFDILVMIFVNYVAGMPAIPFLLRHAPTEMDAYTLTDVVFPGFLFIVGAAIPLSLEKRLGRGDPLVRILGRLLVRTAGLLFLGVIMVNEGRFDAAATGFSKPLWFFLAYVAVVALWNTYPKTEDAGRRRVYLALRIGAMVLLAVLAIVFRGSAEGGAATGLRTSWWGILGLIGWAYFACSLVYMAVRANRTALLGAMGLMLALYIGSRHGALAFLGSLTEALDFGVLFGAHGAIVTAGMLAGTCFLGAGDGNSPRARVRFLLPFGAGLVAAGYLLRPLHGFSKNNATESWALATSGICCLLLLGFYLLLDVLKARRWAAFLQPIGMNPLLAYILPDFFACAAALLFGLFHVDAGRLFWPGWKAGGLPGMLNAAVMTGVMLALTWAFTRKKIILKF